MTTNEAATEDLGSATRASRDSRRIEELWERVRKSDEELRRSHDAFHAERDSLNTEINGLRGIISVRDSLISELKRHVSDLRKPADTLNTLYDARDDLGDSLIDEAVVNGELVKCKIDANLGGEKLVWCSFAHRRGGKKYQIDLVSTEYRIREVI